MTWPNIISIIGILLSSGLGFYNAVINYSITKQNRFVGTITSERIKRMEKLGRDISIFCGLTSFWVKSLRNTGSEESLEVLREVDILKVMIKLRLNPNGTFDKQIIIILDKIPKLTDKMAIDDLNSALDELTYLSQELLKEEWERIKSETEKGRKAKAKIVTL